MFICLEGIAGAGKTTQTRLLADYLESAKKKEVLISAAYEGDRRKVVSDFMNVSGIKPDQNAVMFLFQALHAAQYHEVSQALTANKIVITDRWRYSFFAHHLQQNTFDGDKKLMHQLDILAYRTLEPDIVFLLDVPSSIAYERYLRREQLINDSGLNLMDRKYFTSVYDYYKQLALNRGWHIVDGVQDIGIISDEIKDFVCQRL